jgi:hypothetical protein
MAAFMSDPFEQVNKSKSLLHAGLGSAGCLLAGHQGVTVTWHYGNSADSSAMHLHEDSLRRACIMSTQ